MLQNVTYSFIDGGPMTKTHQYKYKNLTVRFTYVFDEFADMMFESTDVFKTPKIRPSLDNKNLSIEFNNIRCDNLEDWKAIKGNTDNAIIFCETCQKHFKNMIEEKEELKSFFETTEKVLMFELP